MFLPKIQVKIEKSQKIIVLGKVLILYSLHSKPPYKLLKKKNVKPLNFDLKKMVNQLSFKLLTILF